MRRLPVWRRWRSALCCSGTCIKRAVERVWLPPKVSFPLRGCNRCAAACVESGTGDFLMKRHLSVFSALVTVVFLACAGAAKAQDAPAGSKPANLAGTWSVSFETPNGTMTQTLTLSQDGTTLTGTIGGERGTAEVKGSVSGNNVSFSAVRKGQHGTFT